MKTASVKRVVFAVLATMLVTVFVGCKTPDVSGDLPESKYGGTAVLRIPGDPNTLTPLTKTGSVSGWVDKFTHEPLVILNEEGKFEGRLVKDWSVSDDNLVYTFTLKDNIKWHDGMPITADDVVFTHDLVMNPDTGLTNVRPDQFINGEPIRYEKVSDNQFAVVLPEPYAPLLSMMVNPIPKHIWQDVDPKDYRSSEKGHLPVLSGPFKFEEYKAGEYVKLARFDEYWEGKPYLDEVILQVIPDDNATLVALKTGQVHLSLVDGINLQQLKEEGQLDIVEFPGQVLQALTMNLQRPPFDDVRVRRAVSHLLDRESIVDKAFMGQAVPAHSPLTPSHLFYDEDAVVKYEFDVDKAKQLLEEAGYKLGEKGMEKDGKVLEFDLLIRAGSPDNEQAGIIIQSDCAKAGVKVNLRTTDWNQIVAILLSEERPRNFDATIVGYGMTPEPAAVARVYTIDADFYACAFSPEADEQFDRGQREIDPDARAECYREVQRILTEQAVAGFLWYRGSNSAFSPLLKTDESKLSRYAAEPPVMYPAKLYLSK